MQVHLQRVDDAFHFTAKGAADIQIHIDAAKSIGGHNAGARPMELILMSLASCSAIDIVEILRKQRQMIKNFEIVVEGERRNVIPAVFEKIRINFIVTGNLDEHKVRRAIDLSLQKYCSVSAMLEPKVKIDYTLELKTTTD